MANDIATGIDAFIRRQFRIKDQDTGFTPDVHLWEDGYIDSAGAIELIAHIEAVHGIELTQEILFDPDFTTVRGIARLVGRAIEAKQRCVA
jgi:acyl carrier protein